MTSLRISAHKLAIEMGRYSRPPTPADQRLCLNCETSQVEDEYQYLTQCSKYADDREVMYGKNIVLCPNFENLSSEDKFLHMMTADDEILYTVAHFVNKISHE